MIDFNIETVGCILASSLPLDQQTDRAKDAKFPMVATMCQHEWYFKGPWDTPKSIYKNCYELIAFNKIGTYIISLVLYIDLGACGTG